MDTLVWVGFDVGKKKFSAALDLTQESGRLKLASLPQKEFDRTPQGVEKFFRWASEKASDAQFSIVMETTGSYSQILAGWLLEQHSDLHVSIVNAWQLHNYIQSLNLANKTDALDAKAIARFGSERQPKATRLPSAQQRELQELTRERTALINARVELSNRRDSLTSALVRRINGQTLASLTVQIEKLDKEIKALVVQDEELCNEVHILTTMPGVSFISAYSILAELGSLKQYGKKELSALSGLAPRIIESGSSVHSSHLSRRSSGRLRQILYLDSMIGVQKIPQLNAMYQRLFKRGKKKMQARCACMRKMLLMMRSMVIHKQPYNENFFKFQSESI